MKSFTLTRRIAARPSIVFDALTTADGVAAWWGPDDLPVILAEVDARKGGCYRVRFRTADGLEHEACGEYLEVVRPQRLVMSWRWASGGEAEEAGQTSRIEIGLTAIATGTELVFTHGELRNDASAKSHERGWTGALTKLVRHLESANGAPAATMARRSAIAITSGAIALAASFGGVALMACGRAAGGTGLSSENEAVIRSWYKGWEKKDWHPLDVLLADDFTFTSAAGDDHISKSEFKKNCWDTQIDLTQRLDVQRIFGGGNEAFVLYVGLTKNGKTFRNVEYLRLKDGKIEAIECYFGAQASFPSGVGGGKK
ncbi:MAG TPA: SRPBCC domain-containing protein [Polyangiaceae bacterium]|jgi:uncharacterized protein YndB with AHSA1/START domain/ketosteroid isomerase-like protein